MKKSIIFVSLLIFFASVGFVSAHVVVKPSEVGVGAFQTFDMGVPVEKDLPTVGLKLIIPNGLTDVSPNVMPGWTISIIKSGTGADATTTAIEWYGNSIPAGERDDFYFSAKVPSTSTTLDWKAYQTYSDGSVISWDHNPSENITDFSTAGPYSQTAVVNDLTPASGTSKATNSSLTISLVALIFSIIALGLARGSVKNHHQA